MLTSLKNIMPNKLVKKNIDKGPGSGPSQEPGEHSLSADGNLCSLIRSCPMSYCDMYIQPETSFEILRRFGDMCCVQFVDMIPNVKAYRRYYISEVCRCDEMERKLRFMQSEMEKDNIYMPHPKTVPDAIHPNEMLYYENSLEKWESDISDMAEYKAILLKDLLEIKEMFYLFTNIGPLFGDAELQKEAKLSKSNTRDIGPGGRLIITTGVVKRKLAHSFEIMLWRISHGNIYFRLAEYDQLLQDPYTGVEIRKVAFLAVCQGEALGKRMEKVAAGFRVNIYPCPQGRKERLALIGKIADRKVDLQEVVNKTKYHRCKALRVAGRQWRSWMIQVRKTKAIYHNMNLFNLDITRKVLIGQCWVPNKDLRRVQDTLDYCSKMTGTTVPSFMSKNVTGTMVSPTYHNTNKFTQGFQVLVDGYGVSKYGEINPGLYTIITFPFLFALMFGDVGHALILVAAGLWLVIKEKEYEAQHSDSEIWNIFFHGRYVILLMGMFSLYTGFIYNDFFGRCLVIVNPMWMTKDTLANVNENLLQQSFLRIDPAGDLGKPYVFGVDPTWTLAKNKIVYENSLKMKVSLIIGTIHMIFGIILSCFNYVRFKDNIGICFRFIPEILFLSCIFLWLVAMIYMKWLIYSAQHKDPVYGSACAPPVLIFFIDMILMKETEALEGCEAYIFEAQPYVQMVLMAIAVCCIPVMLFLPPIVTHYKSKQNRELRKMNVKFNEETPHPVAFSDLMINQGVHTIEFVLSTISHTASYLRLWALSLAHSQLAEMLWTMVLSKLAIRDHSTVGAVKLFFIFPLWAAFTVCILVVMEGLSAFLHTLRLHWVEFMSKFFQGGGYAFQPFCFKTVLAMDEKPEGACAPRKKSKLRASRFGREDSV